MVCRHAWLAVLGAASVLVACGEDEAQSRAGKIPDAAAGSAGSGGGSSPGGAGGAASGTRDAALNDVAAGGAPPGVNDSSHDGGSGGRAGATGQEGGLDGGGHADATDPAADAAATSRSYACSLILGIATTNEWFGRFEEAVDDTRWELKFQDSAHIEKWADPAHDVWSLPITSPCEEHPDEPDRILFMGVNYDYATVDLFLPKYVAVLNNIRAKYPSVKRVDVMTYTRGPGNRECVDAERPSYSYIKPAQDEAIERFAAAYLGFVFPAPRWEVRSCDDFTLCPHLTGDANAVISKTIGEYFSTH